MRQVTTAFKILLGAKEVCDNSAEAGECGKLKGSERGKAYNSHKDVKHLKL